VLVNLFSHTIQQAQAGTILLKLAVNNTQSTLKLHFTTEPNGAGPSAAYDLIMELAGRLGWTMHVDEHDALKTVTLQMVLNRPTILVVDDNQGLVDLLSRYLSGHACRVVGATSGKEGLKLAQQILPEAIILDIMMPEMDGWELLQRLRGFQTLAETPIIICSVFNDPELAYSLGASLFLPKPISRSKVLTALQQVGVVG
jgi:CheY-like chemotaxis protein